MNRVNPCAEGKEGCCGTCTSIGSQLADVIYALSAYPLGMLADRWGLKRVFLPELGRVVLVYVGIAASLERWAYLPHIL